MAETDIERGEVLGKTGIKYSLIGLGAVGGSKTASYLGTKKVIGKPKITQTSKKTVVHEGVGKTPFETYEPGDTIITYQTKYPLGRKLTDVKIRVKPSGGLIKIERTGKLKSVLIQSPSGKILGFEGVGEGTGEIFAQQGQTALLKQYYKGELLSTTKAKPLAFLDTEISTDTFAKFDYDSGVMRLESHKRTKLVQTKTTGKAFEFRGKDISGSGVIKVRSVQSDTVGRAMILGFESTGRIVNPSGLNIIESSIVSRTTKPVRLNIGSYRQILPSIISKQSAPIISSTQVFFEQGVTQTPFMQKGSLTYNPNLVTKTVTTRVLEGTFSMRGTKHPKTFFTETSEFYKLALKKEATSLKEFFGGAKGRKGRVLIGVSKSQFDISKPPTKTLKTQSDITTASQFSLYKSQFGVTTTRLTSPKISSVKMRVPSLKSESILKVNTKTSTILSISLINALKSSQLSRNLLETKQFMNQELLSFQSQKVGSLLIQSSKVAQSSVLDQTMRSKTQSKLVTTTGGGVYNPLINIPGFVPPTTTGFGGWFALGGSQYKRKVRGKKGKRKERYQASFGAYIYGLKGKQRAFTQFGEVVREPKKKGGVYSLLGFRPIL